MSQNHTTIAEIYELTVKDFIEPVDVNNSFIKKSDDIDVVFHLLGKKNHLWVVDDAETMRLCGVITESDTIQLFTPAHPTQAFDQPHLQSFQYGLSMTAEEIMSKQPITAALDEKITDVIIKMTQHKIKHLAVTDENNRLTGEIALKSLINEYLKRKSHIDKKKETDTPEITPHDS